MHIYPAAGLKVRDPVKKDLLPDEGREVSDHDIYWLRRLADGDVTTQPPAASCPTTSLRIRSNEE